MQVPVIHTGDYNYDLPDHKIAKYPLDERDASKLLVCKNGVCITDTYKNIAKHLPENALLVFNNSKVIPARIQYVKETKGIIEIFCLEPKNGTPPQALQQKGKSIWLCLIGGFKKWKSGSKLIWQIFNDEVNAAVIKKNESNFEIEFSWSDPGKTFAEILELLGQIPIPPYLLRKAAESDKERYQTRYASVDGSVAAPTAGLHFTDKLMKSFAKKNIARAFTTLHVGAGTFKPVSANFAHEHVMHAEWIEADIAFIEQLCRSENIICVGTTCLRTVESIYWFAVAHFEKETINNHDYVMPQFLPYEKNEGRSRKKIFTWLRDTMKKNQIEKLVFKTSLMILPGYTMRVANYLVTNFHQPKSTLLMLVDAFTKGRWKPIYDYALQHDFRFLSYGDGCLLQYE